MLVVSCINDLRLVFLGLDNVRSERLVIDLGAFPATPLVCNGNHSVDEPVCSMRLTFLARIHPIACDG